MDKFYGVSQRRQKIVPSCKYEEGIALVSCMLGLEMTMESRKSKAEIFYLLKAGQQKLKNVMSTIRKCAWVHSFTVTAIELETFTRFPFHWKDHRSSSKNLLPREVSCQFAPLDLSFPCCDYWSKNKRAPERSFCFEKEKKRQNTKTICLPRTSHILFFAWRDSLHPIAALILLRDTQTRRQLSSSWVNVSSSSSPFFRDRI